MINMVRKITDIFHYLKLVIISMFPKISIIIIKIKTFKI